MYLTLASTVRIYFKPCNYQGQGCIIKINVKTALAYIAMNKPILSNFRIQPEGRISKICLSKELYTLEEVITHLKVLPYGRTSDKRDLAMVLVEGRGTCSAKHALLVQLANENGHENIRLALCTYGMTASVHPEVSVILQQHQLEVIPEARCFVKFQGGIYNLCGQRSPLQPDIISEIEIAPMQTATFKRRYHKNYIENWLRIERLNRRWDSEEVWNIREACIQAVQDESQLLHCA